MCVSKSLSNEYYIYSGSEIILLNVLDSEQTVDHLFFTYTVKVFEVIEKSLEVGGFVFYLTDNIHELPSYGQNVVAVVVGDELCRIPSYFHKVRAVFKTYGTRPILGCNPLLKPSYLNFLNLIKFLRNWLICLPGMLNYVFHKFKSLQPGTANIPPIYTFPLGYGNQLDLPIKDIESRPYDIYFAGSVDWKPLPVWSLRSLFQSPKSLARKKMISSINTLKEKHPDLEVELLLTEGFGHGHKGSVDARTYSEKIMDTKICLVPRGSALETWRFCEGLRAGCIVVREALPSRWFYDGSPTIEITDWNDLDGIVERLSKSKHLRQEKHQESLNWWKSKCSEAVVAAYMVEKLAISSQKLASRSLPELNATP